MRLHKVENGLCIAMLLLSCLAVRAQEHGDPIYRARNDHSGNQIRLTFRNSGHMGFSDTDHQMPIYGAEWPLNSGIAQLGIAADYIAAELTILTPDENGDSTYVKITPVVWCQTGPLDRMHTDENGKFLGFEPLPGYLNIDNDDFFHKVAMSHQRFTWPSFWPNKLDDATDPGWRGSWNGYFGKNVMNADQESFYMMDDWTVKRSVHGIPLPLPDPTDPNRGGLGLRQKVRGLQWSNPSVQDAIFWIYDIKNIGQLRLTKTVFGFNVGGALGSRLTIGDTQDDAAVFFRENNLTATYDYNNIGEGGYTPVPWLGFTYLESPGNALDGIDNDGDGVGGGSAIITLADFEPRTISVGDPIVTIDYGSDTYRRTLTTMPAEGVTFTFNKQTFTLKPDSTYLEVPRNGIDDNLNGLIDENDGVQLETGEVFYLYIRSTYNDQDYAKVDYLGGEVGGENLLIDERRDDGIDNDGDWNVLNDDVGLDGAPGTGDEGEGDGQPTPGRGDLPGEPNIDLVDVSESDQIGLTSFIFYIWPTMTWGDDDHIWRISRPGFFDNRLENVDADYMASSGYFPLLPGQNEMFSVSLLYGWDEAQLIRNKNVVQSVYDANYNFAVAPELPTLTAVAGDGKVTLYWDDVAELSLDRFLGNDYDFEGYKIYRATDPGFSDAGTITDGFGTPNYYTKPLKVYDKIDGVYGFFPLTLEKGVQFYLGSDSGLRHSYVDNDVTNGVTYYYAVTAYDRGDVEKKILPTETSKFIAVSAAGDVVRAPNVVVVTPTVASSGYIPPGFDITPTRTSSGALTSGQVAVAILEPEKIPGGGQFAIEFMDIATDGQDNDLDGLVDADDADEFLPLETSGLVLKDISDRSAPRVLDTIWFKELRVVSDTVVKEIQNLYNDDDGDRSTLRFISSGMEFFVRNPFEGTYNDPDKGILNGIKWSSNIAVESAYPLSFGVWSDPRFVPGVSYPGQYRMVFFDEVVDTTSEIRLPTLTGSGRRIRAQEANFKIYDMATGEQAKYAYKPGGVRRGASNAPDGFYSANDEIWFYQEGKEGELIVTYYLWNAAEDDTSFENAHGRHLSSGDTLYLYPDFQFTSADRFEFSTFAQKVDMEAARSALDDIRVVPNPYVVSAGWEPRNLYTTGRGERRLVFNHLPQKCRIRIYTVSGSLVQTIEHDAPMTDGSAEWDMLSKDNMEISYGLYLYHVEAPGIGEHVGRFIVIK